MSTGSISVSVVVPCFNVSPHIARCLSSILAQGAVVSELICVDDGSTDDTVRRMEGTGLFDGTRWRIIRQTNQGASAARNTGLRHCTSEFVQFLDADDELLPGKLEHQMRLMSGMPDVAILCGSYRIKADDGTVVREVVQKPGKRDPWSDLVQHRLSITSPCLFRRDAVVRAGGWDEQLGSSQEYDLMFRILQQGGAVAYDDQVLTETHQRTGSISHTNLAANWTRHAELRGRVAHYLRALDDGRDMRPFDQAVFDSIRILYQHDPDNAQELYRELLPKGFKPSVSPATGRTYVTIHGMLGFRAAEWIRKLVGR